MRWTFVLVLVVSPAAVLTQGGPVTSAPRDRGGSTMAQEVSEPATTGAITGRVVDCFGNGRPNVSVMLRIPGWPDPLQTDNDGVYGFPDDDGVYAFRNLPPREYELAFELSDGRSEGRRPIVRSGHLSAGELEEVVVVLCPPTPSVVDEIRACYVVWPVVRGGETTSRTVEVPCPHEDDRKPGQRP